ncbi:hypothetical protein [Acinetobacter wuhouensis]|uniref:Uncharacterized protein n=1 Tax=Acinetobacter wuhouensis TaxID=1879050 RepID=A0A3G2T889_9GAMM|nr:hypothetical protein [Acinetobacter wuhouensis]AYO55786.1 hypothetical protein CDG68_19995 [Acinetobacter wuhouensis]RZG47323.1 hypothetical protein EXU28_07080 [Acinetobacter wuhouensis]
MNRLVVISALCLGVLSGCATTQNLVSKVSGGSTPLDQVLNERSDLRKNLATVELRQYFNKVENPTVAEVKLTETGLMDDSVRSIRTVYSFKNIDGQWKRVDTQKEYQCYRGKNTKTFQKAKCA